MFQEMAISPELRAEAQLMPRLARATEILEKAVNTPTFETASKSVQVKWEKEGQTPNQGRVALTLKDWSGEVHASFTPEELASDGKGLWVLAD